jgi:hypothetical protein
MEPLTKTDYLNALQCSLYAWHSFNKPLDIPDLNEVEEDRLEQGRIVGELARTLYSNGMSVKGDTVKSNLKNTQESLNEGVALFEAGFEYEGSYVRTDILVPGENGAWDIIEVKSSTSVDKANIHDVAFQKYVCENAGLNVGKCYVAHINKEYIKNGEIDPQQLFVLEDISGGVEQAYQANPKGANDLLKMNIEDRVNAIIDVISSEEPPGKHEDMIGQHCVKAKIYKNEHACPLKKKHWKHLPQYNVFELCGGWKKSLELVEMGIKTIDKIPEDYELNDKQTIQKWCVETGEKYIDTAAIKGLLDTLEYPLRFMDFETRATAIPKFDGTKPYDQIPFQFGVHVQEKDGDEIKPISFIDLEQGDPRLRFLENLKNAVGDEGSVIVQYEPFEKARLRELKEVFPQHSEWVDNLLERIVDIYPLFKNFSVHDKSQKGSASIKYVIPMMIGESYEDDAITNGLQAGVVYEHLISGEATSFELTEHKEWLEHYCSGMDVGGMALVVEELKKIAKSGEDTTDQVQLPPPKKKKSKKK